ncbi:MAG TPA: hypothetical protein VLE23_13030 [Geminicoccaceae bacterium]|nr:hypothetical protein [Geminicoccaceae bacterium]
MRDLELAHDLGMLVERQDQRRVAAFVTQMNVGSHADLDVIRDLAAHLRRRLAREDLQKIIELGDQLG